MPRSRVWVQVGDGTTGGVRQAQAADIAHGQGERDGCAMDGRSVHGEQADDGAEQEQAVVRRERRTDSDRQTRMAGMARQWWEQRDVHKQCARMSRGKSRRRGQPVEDEDDVGRASNEENNEKKVRRSVCLETGGKRTPLTYLA